MSYNSHSLPGEFCRRVLVLGFVVAACTPKPKPLTPQQLHAQAIDVERRADADPRRTREALFDDARDKYRAACDAGHSAACDDYDRLNAMLRERRGTCDDAPACLALARTWLPDWRGEQRLRRLCLGQRIGKGKHAPPAWQPHGPACIALGDFYRDAGRADEASFFYSAGCDGAADSEACRREAERALATANALDPDSRNPGRATALTTAAARLDTACGRDDALACAMRGRVALAQQRLRFPHEQSLRYSLDGGDPHEYLNDARTALARACELELADACTEVGEVDAELARVDGLLAKGCAFRDTCAEDEVCNESTGRCESAKKKGKFFEAYENGVARYDKRDYDKARKAFESARDMAPSLPGPWRWLALIALRQRRFADCVDAAREALRLNPESEHADALSQLALHCASQKR